MQFLGGENLPFVRYWYLVAEFSCRLHLVKFFRRFDFRSLPTNDATNQFVQHCLVFSVLTAHGSPTENGVGPQEGVVKPNLQDFHISIQTLDEDLLSKT